MEIVLDRLTKTVRSGREKLQATAPAPEAVEAPVGAADGEPAEGFFDQDLV
jgi:hypothetical protein